MSAIYQVKKIYFFLTFLLLKHTPVSSHICISLIKWCLVKLVYLSQIDHFILKTSKSFLDKRRQEAKNSYTMDMHMEVSTLLKWQLAFLNKLQTPSKSSLENKKLMKIEALLSVFNILWQKMKFGFVCGCFPNFKKWNIVP